MYLKNGWSHLVHIWGGGRWKCFAWINEAGFLIRLPWQPITRESGNLTALQFDVIIQIWREKLRKKNPAPLIPASMSAEHNVPNLTIYDIAFLIYIRYIFSQSADLHGYHGNQNQVISMYLFWIFAIWAFIWYKTL